MKRLFNKRFWAILLVMLMMVQVLPLSAAAAEPTEEPTPTPTAEPTPEPTEEPTEEPTAEPTAEPTEEPTAEPTPEPTAEPTPEPTAEPTPEPTAEPTPEPTEAPEGKRALTAEPQAEPTEEPKEETKQFTLHYELNGGEAKLEDVTADEGTEVTVADAPTKENNNFTGWLANDEAGTVYQPGETLTLTGDVTLTAQWEIKQVTLHFDGNGGTTTKTDDVGAAGRKVTLKIYQNDATREGYQFLGWNTDKDAADGDPVLYKGGNVTWPKTKTVELGEEDVTLYAIWGENHTLTLDDNGAGLSGWPKTATGAYVRGITTKPSRSGYQFLGWSLSQDGGELNTDYTKSTNWLRLEQDVTLYAQWKEYTYTVVFDLNGGEGTLPEAITYTAATKDDTTITVPGADGYTKEGCTLVGWSFNTKRGDLKYNGTLNKADYAPGAEIPSTKLSTPSKDTTYTVYAVWKANEVKVSLDLNGGAMFTEGRSYPKSWSYGVTAATPLTGPAAKAIDTSLVRDNEASNYFEGWYSPTLDRYLNNGNTTNKNNGTATWTITEDTLLIAVFRYTVVTFMDGEEQLSQAAVHYDHRTRSVDIPVTMPDGPDKDHQRFLGWAEEEGGEIVYEADDTYDGIRDLVLYAVYEDIATLTYDLNGAEGEIEAVTEAVGTEITVADAPTREGYRFLGWLEAAPGTKAPAEDPDAEGEEKLYQPGDTFVLNGDTTLVAQWIEVFTVTWEDGFGEVLHTEEVDNDAAAEGYAETPTHEGYTFTGWDKELPETITEDVTLTAQWEINKYTVAYEDGFGETLYTETVEHGSAAKGYSETPTHEGKTFTGWDKELPETITEDVILTAQWEPLKLTVTWVDGFGKTLNTETVEYGAAAKGYSETPTHEGKTFTGWDKELPETITEDVTLTAQWIDVYTVTYVDGFGKTLNTETVEYGAAAKGYTGTPTHEGKTFKGWDKKLPEKITEDVTVTAQWETVQCTVIYRDGFGNNLYVKKVEYGGSVKPYDKKPTHPGFLFTCWDKKLPKVITEDIIITALWRVDETVPFTMFVGSDLRIAGQGESADNFKKLVQYAIDNRGDVTALVTTGNLVDRFDDRAAWNLARNTVSTLPKYMNYYGVAGASDVNGDALYYDEYLQPGLNDACNLNFYACGRIWYQRSSREALMLMGIGYQKMPETQHERDQQAAWLQFVNDAVRIHAGYSVVLLVNDYMDADGELTEFGKLLEEKFISVNPNVRLVLCGNAEGSAHTEKTYADGHTVHALLFNYGADKENGTGFLRKMSFSLLDRSVTVSTYSPILDRTAYDAEHPENDSFTIKNAF